MHQKGGGMNGHQLALQNSMKPKSSQSVLCQNDSVLRVMEIVLTEV